MKRKRAGRILFCAALAALVPSLTAGAKNDENTFTFWLANGEKDEFYMDYAENPIIQYLMAQEWGEGDNAATLTLEFDAASSTNPADSFTTLIYGGDFQDVMDLNYSQSSVTQLYDEGIAMDLTELAEEYMPNYMALIRSDPALYREAVSIVDGEQKILKILCINDMGQDQYQGLMYRRDWLVRFGEMPEYVWAVNADEILEMDWEERQGAAPEITNYYEAREAYGTDESAWTAGGWQKNPLYTADSEDSWEVGVGGTRGNGITCSYGDDSMNTYTDNLVFPSGTQDPVFLSDWEWMLQTYEEKVWNNPDYTDDSGAMLSSDNTYMMSLYYWGTSTRGDFSSAFGGGAPTIYYDADSGKIVSGLTSESTRLYLQYMNEWYQKGWIDRDFTTRTSDIFYKIDAAGQLSGAVPVYLGHKTSQLGSVLDNGSIALTKGIMVVGAPLPINDVIGENEYRFKEPDTIYMMGRVAGSSMITTAAEDKNLPALLSLIDYLYTEEGGVLASFGFSKEQYEETQDAFYTEYGLTEGAYVKEDNAETGKTYRWADNNPESQDLNGAARLNRLSLGYHYMGVMDHGYSAIEQQAIDNWNRYPNTGDILTDIAGKIEADDTYNTAYAKMTEAMQSRLASPIKAPDETTFGYAWEDWVNAIGDAGDILQEYAQAAYDLYSAAAE
ncbi:hypothetical protein BRYFOR_06081 [Marvinbryantia formatexigens DSM 14469]|uniref:ABC transporter, solute-binding protein n=1 Tax=Marvinbryantia formatexigens DSM 14469 TaxID=478749 RepID=C6LBT6_9FIRM|nr:hypothetical protein [Marvinbryantia formatexigens]EET61889.1 hypothetical protein BRYFOR_06081 [Marvinbryantia formatexigens DSM 14469]UWO25761.1 hypothetical protein NQ534_04585 [Marvinbryantia formatexigens DSM 14469]SDF36024.1 hypothetical protein SAMN05660368_00561 [Marvinbryantia formatexigens]